MDTLIRTGSPAPQFEMTDLNGHLHTLANNAGKICVLIFWSAECSWSERADHALQSMQAAWGKQVVVFRIASNANETHQLIYTVSKERKIEPMILDTQQTLANLFQAQITPEVFVFDGGGILRYQGGFDNANFRQPEPTRNYLWEAVQSIIAGENPTPQSTKAYGCTIVFNTEE